MIGKDGSNKPMYTIRFFNLFKKHHKPFKLPAAKNLFSSLYITGTTCFDECFLFHVGNGSFLFFMKV